MLRTFRNLLGRIRANLIRLDNQPLGKAALIIILFLDLFILISVFNGLEEHTRQLTSPDEHIPSICRQIVIDSDWNQTNRMENLSGIVLTHDTSYYRIERRRADSHPVCAPYVDLLDRIERDKELTKAFADRAEFAREAEQLRLEINNLKGVYDTSLLETIAGQQQETENVAAVRKELHEKAITLDTLTAQVAALDQRVNGNAVIGQLWMRLEGLREQDRDTLKTDLRRLNFWFPAKKLAMQLVFLLPLFAAFYVWNGVSIRKGRGVQTLVSSHLLVVSSVPILFKVVEAVYDIIPKKLLERFIELLESFKLVAIWHYLVIVFAVGGALFLIYVFQKKLFSREKLIERRIARGLCQECGKRLPPGSPACPFCGFAQFKPCGRCAKATLVYGKYCRECGAPLTGS